MFTSLSRFYGICISLLENSCFHFSHFKKKVSKLFFTYCYCYRTSKTHSRWALHTTYVRINKIFKQTGCWRTLFHNHHRLQQSSHMMTLTLQLFHFATFTTERIQIRTSHWPQTVWHAPVKGGVIISIIIIISKRSDTMLARVAERLYTKIYPENKTEWNNIFIGTKYI